MPFPLITLLFSSFLLSHSLLALPDPDAAALQSLQPLFPNPSPSATIPAFPEQSAAAACPLDLSDDFFHAVNTACAATKKHSPSDGELHRSRCCPVLAAWLYSAYSATALGNRKPQSPHHQTAPYDNYDMPLLPDDSETCVSDLGKALRGRGMDLFQPNESCDAVYCYCGIRLHPLSCPEVFSGKNGGIVENEDEEVRMLERNCLSTSSNVDRFPGLGGCSKCLNTLYKLNKKASNSSKSSQDRTTKIHNKDCELMGLTWLLAKNRSAYIHTVSGVLRAFMLTKDGSNPRSCTLNSDGMPLAVDSSEFSDQSPSFRLEPPFFLCFFFLLCLLLYSLPNSH
ncbi:putative GPI-anchored protein [Senna tora]|uniref:Putative GPI-anchored protein n=1 Tax=Senna tora TaxID=362788 RepID=A0A834TER9_9FABA|nr:putative GPI-anchored protein [Senna tora]